MYKFQKMIDEMMYENEKSRIKYLHQRRAILLKYCENFYRKFYGLISEAYFIISFTNSRIVNDFFFILQI